MTHCGWFRLANGAVVRAPAKPQSATCMEHSKTVIAWSVATVTNTRAACDPDHPFGTSPACPCGR